MLLFILPYYVIINLIVTSPEEHPIPKINTLPTPEINHDFMVGGRELFESVGAIRQLYAEGAQPDPETVLDLHRDLQFSLSDVRSNLKLDQHYNVANLSDDELISRLHTEASIFSEAIEARHDHLITLVNRYISVAFELSDAGFLPLTRDQLAARLERTTVGFVSPLGEDTATDSSFIRNVRQVFFKSDLPDDILEEAVFHELTHAIIAGESNTTDDEGFVHATRSGMSVKLDDGTWDSVNDDEIITDTIAMILLWKSRNPHETLQFDDFADLIIQSMEVGDAYQITKEMLLERFRIVPTDIILNAYCKEDNDEFEDDELAKTRAVERYEQEIARNLGAHALGLFGHPSRELDVVFDSVPDDEKIPEPALTQIRGLSHDIVVRALSSHDTERTATQYDRLNP